MYMALTSFHQSVMTAVYSPRVGGILRPSNLFLISVAISFYVLCKFAFVGCFIEDATD